jgi:hypothetical protein
MSAGLAIFAVYAVLVIVLVTRYDRHRKDSPRITGRGGDFE